MRATIDPRRLVLLDESGTNIATGRSQAWIQSGTELVESRLRNRGDNLTMIGAIRASGWVTMSTWWHATTAARFVTWIRRRLSPKLSAGDIVVIDNLAAHNHDRVEALITARGATVHYLPPYGHDLNPIEPGWGFVKKPLRGAAPRNGRVLRRTAQRASRAIRPRHCQNRFAHAGYAVNSTERWD